MVAILQKQVKVRLTSAYIFDIGHPCYGQWQLSKQGIRWPVSHDHITGSDSELVEVGFFFLKFTADQVMVCIVSWAQVLYFSANGQ